MNKHQHIPEEQLEEIERFLQHQMSPKETQSFLLRLSADAELEKSTNEMQLLVTGIQEASLQKKLAHFHEDLSPVSNIKKRGTATIITFKKALVAASIVGVIAVLGWLFLLKDTKEESLFAQYFQPDAGLISAMSTSDNYEFDRAMIHYKTGNYSAAIKTWDSLQTINPNNDTLNYFLGSAYLAKKEVGKAIPYMQKVSAAPNSFFVKDAHWYLGLALLKQGKKKEAIPFLKSSDHAQKDKLIQKLNE